MRYDRCINCLYRVFDIGGETEMKTADIQELVLIGFTETLYILLPLVVALVLIYSFLRWMD